MKNRRVIRIPAFRENLGGISTTTFWRLSQELDFPKKVKISKRLVGYYADEAQAYINSRQVGGDSHE